MHQTLSRKSNDQLDADSEDLSEANADEVQFVRCRAYSYTNDAQLEKFAFGLPGRSESCRLNARSSSNNPFDQRSIEDLRFAYDQAVKREARLIDELSGKSAEMEEIQENFQYAIDFGLKLEVENQELKTQLREYIEWNNTLKSLNQELENRNAMLMNSVRELDEAESQTRFALKRAKRASYRLVKDLNFQKQLREELQQDCSEQIESSVQDITGKLKKEVELERNVRLRAEKQHSVTDQQLVEKEGAFKDAMSKIKKLELTLKEKEDKYSRLLVELSTEKANLERKYEELHSNFTVMEEELAKHYDNTNDRVSANTTVLTCNASFRESVVLSNEILLLEEGDERVELISSRSIGSCGSSSEVRVKDLSKHGIFQEYLYVTTAAVKLHFPDLIEDVSSQELIEVVETSPFHLWYDLMMHYMRIVVNRKSIAKKQVRKKMITADQEVQSEKMSWIYRIFKRTNNITSTKACSTNVNKSKENNPELEMSNKVGIAQKARRVQMSDNKLQSGEMEEKYNVHKGQDTQSFTLGKQTSAGYSIII